MYLALGRRFAGQLFCFYRNRFAAQISVLHPEPFEEDFSQMVAGLLMQYCPFFGNFLKGKLSLFCFVVLFYFVVILFCLFLPSFPLLKDFFLLRYYSVSHADAWVTMSCYTDVKYVSTGLVAGFLFGFFCSVWVFAS